MTYAEKNIAIAQASGWREAFPKDKEPHPETKRGGILLPYYWVNELTHKREMELPDYLSDLNAMADAEKTLMGMKQREYLENLHATVGSGGHSISFRITFPVVTATACQRAEAFLKTIGKL